MVRKTTASNTEVASDENKDDALPVETTENTSDSDVDEKEPATGDLSTGTGGEGEASASQLQQPTDEDGASAYAPNEDNADETVEEPYVETGAGVVAGDGTVQTFIADGGDPAITDIGGDGVTGVSSDKSTYATRDGATGADTNTGLPSTGTTPAAPVPTTADALFSGAVGAKHVANFEAALTEVIESFRNGDKPVTASQNLFDDLGMHRADLTSFAQALNAKFGTTLTVGEAQNFLLVKDVTNMMKRKIAVAATLEA